MRLKLLLPRVDPKPQTTRESPGKLGCLARAFSCRLRLRVNPGQQQLEAHPTPSARSLTGIRPYQAHFYQTPNSHNRSIEHLR